MSSHEDTAAKNKHRKSETCHHCKKLFFVGVDGYVNVDKDHIPEIGKDPVFVCEDCVFSYAYSDVKCDGCGWYHTEDVMYSEPVAPMSPEYRNFCESCNE